MGGGVGVSLHGSHPVASERFIFAMPETGIGFFPDIGASHLLTHCPGALGMYLGLTGNRLDPAEAKHAGLVKHVVASAQFPKLIESLQDLDLSTEAYARVESCLQSFENPETASELSKYLPLIDACFAKATVEEIIAALRQSNQAWALEVTKVLLHKSPLSLKVTLRQLQNAAGLSLIDCLKMDFNLANHFMQDKDFFRGVNSLLIIKDKNPQWEPASLEEISDKRVQNYFEPAAMKLELEV
jgi:enoyl-CoA hydratase